MFLVNQKIFENSAAVVQARRGAARLLRAGMLRHYKAGRKMPAKVPDQIEAGRRRYMRQDARLRRRPLQERVFWRGQKR